MPAKDIEVRRETARRSYQKHREEVIAKVAKRKRTKYAGTCCNCGGPTVGSSKNDIPEWCNKPECKSEQHKANREVFVETGKAGRIKQKWAQRKASITLAQIIEEWEGR